MDDAVQVRDVVLPDRVMTAAEQRLVGLDEARVRGELRGVQMREQPGDRVPRHQSRQQEVDRQGGPEREGVEGESAG